MLSPRAEELLSYITGLGRVGTALPVPIEWVKEDLPGFHHKNSFYLFVKELIDAGCVRREGVGQYVVLRRLENIPTVYRCPVPEKEVENSRNECAEFAISKQVRADALARIAEIPDDTRSLTGRICGDPLPGRSALDRRRAGLA